MRYSSDDKYDMSELAYKVGRQMEAVKNLDASTQGIDQTTVSIMHQTLVMAYNTLHEYMQDMEQRMREEENG